MTTFPGPAITLSMTPVNVVGDGLRDALDPSQQLSPQRPERRVPRQS
jgi:ABC-type dipeptide/oligopeptide/nickel transport system permease subunit